jgi:hypothetical protein
MTEALEGNHQVHADIMLQLARLKEESIESSKQRQDERKEQLGWQARYAKHEEDEAEAARRVNASMADFKTRLEAGRRDIADHQEHVVNLHRAHARLDSSLEKVVGDLQAERGERDKDVRAVRDMVSRAMQGRSLGASTDGFEGAREETRTKAALHEITALVCVSP